MSSCRCTPHAPRPQLFLFSIPSSCGQECLALFANLEEQYLVLLGDQSCSDSWPGYLGVFGGGAQYGPVWAQGYQTPALGHGQGEGGGQVAGTFSAGRHSASGGDVWALGHGQLGRAQLLGNRLLEPPEGKDRGGPLSAQTWKSSELFHPLGSPGQHCVRSQGRAEVTQTPVRCSGGGVRSPSSYSWGCVLPALWHSVLILPALGTPNSPSTKIHRWSCVPGHMLTTVQERRRPRHCLQGSCSLVGKTAISVSEPAGILPLWMPLAFCLYNSNKHKVQENGFLLEGVWEDGGENGK